MDCLELAKDMLTSINVCEGLYIEEIINKYDGKCELPLVMDTIAQSLRSEHTVAIDCLNGTKIVISDKGRDFLKFICKEGRFEKIMNLKKAVLDLMEENGDAHDEEGNKND